MLNCFQFLLDFIIHIAVGFSGSKCLHFSLQNPMLSYPDYWIFNPESSPAGKLLTCLIYDFQCKWLSKENIENLVVLAPACCRGELSSHEMVHLTVQHPKMCHQGQRYNPEEQILLQWQPGDCCEPCIAEKDNLRFCMRTCCPHVWLLSLIIFTHLLSKYSSVFRIFICIGYCLGFA